MNYIYDIVLNFQDKYYQFFEWNRSDKIKNITRLSVYHIEDEDLNNFIYNQITIDNDFLETIKQENKKYKQLMCLVSNTNQTVGLLFSKEGKLLKRSSLLFEEENEVNNFAKELPITKINYLENIPQKPNYNLRIEVEKKEALSNFITQTKDILPLKYLYYEYFQKENDNYNEIKSSLLNIIEEEWTPNKNKLYSLINLLEKKDSLTK